MTAMYCQCGKFVEGEPFVLGRDCHVCWSRVHNPKYYYILNGHDAPPPPEPKPIDGRACIHLGKRVRYLSGKVKSSKCLPCGGKALDVFSCKLHGEITLATCAKCPDKAFRPKEMGMTWAYGVTTVPSRRGNLLTRTLASLSNAGFDKPRLFVDGERDPMSWETELGLEVTCHYPALRTAGNWVMSLYELYIRNPLADRYAVFQDDFVTYRNLRKYLDSCPYPDKGYWNLYTFPQNQDRAPAKPGWFPSNQKGKGAVALVFSRVAVTTLLAHPHIVRRFQNRGSDDEAIRAREHKYIDGGIVEAFRMAGFKEMVHNPSLVQHTGLRSSMGNGMQPLAPVFNGEDFDVMEFIKPPEPPKRTVQDVLDRLPMLPMGRLSAPIYQGQSGPCVGLAVESMKRHITDEGWQIFEGLEYAGYSLAGYGLPDSSTDVPGIVARTNPAVVVVQDKREWEPVRRDFREPKARFAGIEILRDRTDIFKLTIIKDCQQRTAYHRQSAEEIGCHAWIVYYHPRIACRLAPYVRQEHIVRTYHSVDSSIVPPFNPDRGDTCLLSGYVHHDAYPLRQKIYRMHKSLPGCHYLQHPGYNMKGCHTPDYLRQLSRHKVAICTSSRYGYALRKLIEATACGCVVITDLPTDEMLPEIDGNLIRISPDASQEQIAAAINEGYRIGNPERQAEFSEKAKAYYDFRETGNRLAKDIEIMRANYNARTRSSV